MHKDQALIELSFRNQDLMSVNGLLQDTLKQRDSTIHDLEEELLKFKSNNKWLQQRNLDLASKVSSLESTLGCVQV